MYSQYGSGRNLVNDNDEQSCEGWVLDKSTKEWRPCKKHGNVVAGNNYCNSHQCQAIKNILKELANLETILMEVKSSNNFDSNKISMLEGRIQQVKGNLKNAKTMCENDSECSIKMKDLLVDIEDLLTPGGRMIRTIDPNDPVNRLKQSHDQLNKLSLDTSGADIDARNISKAWELNKRREQENAQDINNIKINLANTLRNTTDKEVQFKNIIVDLSNKLEGIQQEKMKSEQLVEKLKQRLDKCQAQSSTIFGNYNETVSKLKAEHDEYKSRYEQMQAREIAINTSLNNLSKSEMTLKLKIKELKDSYEEKLKKVQDHYAELAKNGGKVLTSKEEELQNEVEELKAELQRVVTELEKAHKTGKMALDHALDVDKPRHELAQDLLNVTKQLREKTTKMGELEEELNKKRTHIAKLQMNAAEQISRNSSADQQEIQRLNQELSSLQKSIAIKQQEITDLQNKLFSIKSTYENRITGLNERIRLAELKLNHVQSQKQQSINDLKYELDQLKLKTSSDTMSFNNQLNEYKKILNQKYLSKSRALQDQYDKQKLRLEEEARQLALVKQQISDQQDIINDQKRKIALYKKNYEEKISNFMLHRNELSSKLIKVQGQANEFGKIEADYKQRILMLRQKIAIDRKKYDLEVGRLKERLNNALTYKNNIQNALQKCSVARETLVTRMKNMTDENNILKNDLQQLKINMDKMRRQYEKHLEKIKTDAYQLERDNQNMSRKMEDVSLAHDHVMQKIKEARDIRKNLETKIRDYQNNEEAFKRLLKDRELGKQEILRLQSALKECSYKSKDLSNRLQSTNKEIHDANYIQNQLNDEIKELSQKYQRTIETQDAEMKREQMLQSAKEDALKRKLREIESSNMALKQKNLAMGKQREIAQNALADSEISHAQQIQMMVDAQKLTNDYPNRGYSTLLK